MSASSIRTKVSTEDDPRSLGSLSPNAGFWTRSRSCGRCASSPLQARPSRRSAHSGPPTGFPGTRSGRTRASLAVVLEPAARAGATRTVDLAFGHLPDLCFLQGSCDSDLTLSEAE